jgi:hypothetical protein
MPIKQTPASRIGGEFELEISLLERQAAPDSIRLPTFEMPFELWVDTGRSALAVALEQTRALGMTGRVWLPDYLCESVLNVFKRLDLSISFYSVSDRLDCAAPAETVKPGDVVLFIHYFGAPNNSALEWVSKLPAGIWVIEDAVQSPGFGKPSSRSDFVLSSLRKFSPQPDGALLGSRHRLDRVKLEEPSEAFVSLRSLGKILRGGNGAASEFLSLFEQSETLIDNDPAVRKISQLSHKLMQRTDFVAAATIRRDNEKVLRALVKDLRSVTPVIDDFQGAAPLGLPVTIEGGRRDQIRQRLAKESIFCPIHWPLEEHPLSRKIITLPLDQRYSDVDMRRVATALKSALEEA